MARLDTIPFGHFCWIDLASHDAASARAFYERLFDWTFRVDAPAGPMEYWMGRKDEALVGGLYAMDDERMGLGVPSHWLQYVCVQDVEAVAQRVEPAGGTLFVPPMDVQEHGRFLIAKDPDGAQLACWQPRQHQGVQLENEVGAPSWHELAPRNVEAARAFYTALLGWTAEETNPHGEAYTLFQQDGKTVAGLAHKPAAWANGEATWLTYMQVADCDASAAQVTALGGSLKIPATNLPDDCCFAVAADTQGATFGLLGPARKVS